MDIFWFIWNVSFTYFKKLNLIMRILKNHKEIVLNLHPFVAAFITKGFPSLRTKWLFEHKKWVKIIPRDAYKYLEYSFHDKKGNKLK